MVFENIDLSSATGIGFGTFFSFQRGLEFVEDGTLAIVRKSQNNLASQFVTGARALQISPINQGRMGLLMAPVMVWNCFQAVKRVAQGTSADKYGDMESVAGLALSLGSTILFKLGLRAGITHSQILGLNRLRLLVAGAGLLMDLVGLVRLKLNGGSAQEVAIRMWYTAAFNFDRGARALLTAGRVSASKGGDMDNRFTISHFDKPSEGAIREALSIQDELAIGKRLLAEGQREAPRGALISGYTEEEMREILGGGGDLFLLHDRVSSKSIGYLLTLSGSQFISHHPQTVVRWGTSKMRTAYETYLHSGRFVYLSQIGIRSDYQSTGAGRALLSAFERKYSDSLIFSAVLKSPLNNVRSHDFFRQAAYVKIGELYTPKFGEMRDVRSSFYVKDPLKQWR